MPGRLGRVSDELVSVVRAVEVTVCTLVVLTVMVAAAVPAVSSARVTVGRTISSLLLPGWAAGTTVVVAEVMVTTPETSVSVTAEPEADAMAGTVVSAALVDDEAEPEAEAASALEVEVASVEEAAGTTVTVCEVSVTVATISVVVSPVSLLGLPRTTEMEVVQTIESEVVKKEIHEVEGAKPGWIVMVLVFIGLPVGTAQLGGLMPAETSVRVGKAADEV